MPAACGLFSACHGARFESLRARRVHLAHSHDRRLRCSSVALPLPQRIAAIGLSLGAVLPAGAVRESDLAGATYTGQMKLQNGFGGMCLVMLAYYGWQKLGMLVPAAGLS